MVEEAAALYVWSASGQVHVVLARGGETAVTSDVRQQPDVGNESPSGDRKPSWRDRLVEVVVMAILVGGVCMIVSGAGQLLSAIWDTIAQIAWGR